MAASQKTVDTDNNHERVGSYEKNRKMLIASMIIVIALIVVVAFSLFPYLFPPPDAGTDGDEEDLTEIVAGRVEECVSDNPSLTQEQCWDLKYHDTAISEDDPSLCEEIKSESIRNHCKKYF